MARPVSIFKKLSSMNRSGMAKMNMKTEALMTKSHILYRNQNTFNVSKTPIITHLNKNIAT